MAIFLIQNNLHMSKTKTQWVYPFLYDSGGMTLLVRLRNLSSCRNILHANQHLVTKYFLSPCLCHCQRHNRVCNYSMRQPYPNKDNGVTSSVPVAPGWQWMRAFQRDFFSNTVASVHTWENERPVLVIISWTERVEVKRTLTFHLSTSVVCPFCIQISEPPIVLDYLW